MLKFQAINLGYFKGDGGVMFGTVPKKYWQRKYPCDAQNMCIMAMRSLLIETDNKLIVVDPGMGDKHLDKVKFYQPFELKNIVDEIEKLGYTKDQVTDVIFTHLHFDHCGGGTIKDDKGNILPTFPNAQYHVSRAQWENYRNPTIFEKSSFFADNIEPLYEMNKLLFIENDIDFTSDVRLELYDGHTPGQIVILFNQDDKRYCYPADLIPTSAHLPLEWLSGYDNHITLAMDEKKRFFQNHGKDLEFIFYHDKKF